MGFEGRPPWKVLFQKQCAHWKFPARFWQTLSPAARRNKARVAGPKKWVLESKMMEFLKEIRENAGGCKVGELGGFRPGAPDHLAAARRLPLGLTGNRAFHWKDRAPKDHPAGAPRDSARRGRRGRRRHGRGCNPGELGRLRRVPLSVRFLRHRTARGYRGLCALIKVMWSFVPNLGYANPGYL